MARAPPWHPRRATLSATASNRQFIADFYSVRAGLVVEIDGPIHKDQQAYDEERTKLLEAMGLRVMRFNNDEVLADPGRVIARIQEEAQTRLLSPEGPGD